VDPSLFAPFPATSGAVMAMDFGQIVQLAMAIEGEDADLGVLASMPPEAGRLTGAMRFEGGAANAGFAVPMELIRFIGELASEKAEEAEVAADAQAEETHDDADEADEAPVEPE
jgi:hypothetical protein